MVPELLKKGSEVWALGFESVYEGLGLQVCGLGLGV